MVQQQRGAGARRAAAPAVQAATTQTATKRLRVGDKAKPAPPAGTIKLRAGTGTTKKGSQTVSGSQRVGTRPVKAIEVFSTDKEFRQKQQGSPRAAPKVLR